MQGPVDLSNQPVFASAAEALKSVADQLPPVKRRKMSETE
jgi:hypothetical protein